ncbi:MAG: aminotransferase class V-fold PLP-dependent enzyme [Thermoanaerobaculia bacterium]|nr:aminotransferase class V-fold PLP-dependent enzyme [Thermoanaerobaculia bacterium]
MSTRKGLESDNAAGARHELEPTTEEMRTLLKRVSERVVAEIRSFPDQPAGPVDDGEAAASMIREDWPPEKVQLDDLLSSVFDSAAPSSFHCAGPGYLAYIPGGGLFHTALADLIGDTLNRYTTVWAAAPALAQVEANVVRWFSSMVGFPRTAGGFLSSGGSIANLSALVAARTDRLPEEFLQGSLYVSTQAHHSIAKAARLAGFPSRNVREIAVDRSFRIKLPDLENQIARDRDAGLKPFLVVGSAGTTNTGAVDPLPEMAEIARREGLWFHVDAAYGGFFLLTERGRQRLAGIELADSATLDPHKGLFLPYGTGCLVVRERETLRRAHGARADYMPPLQDHPDRIDFSEHSPELSRGSRGLRVWLPFKLLGVEPFRSALDEKLDLASWIEGELRRLPDLEIVAPAQLSILAFRASPRGLDEEALDALNTRFLTAINSRQRVFLTSTRLNGRFALRICVLSFRTHRERMQMCLEDVRDALTEVTQP